MADNSKRRIKDLEEIYKNQKKVSEEIIGNLHEEYNQLDNIFDIRKKTIIQKEIEKENQKVINAMEDARIQLLDEGYSIDKNTNNALDNRIKKQKKLINDEEKIKKNKEIILNLVKKTSNTLALTGKYLMENDKIIKQTILNLGLSGAKAETMRYSFEESAGLVARLGGNLRDVQTIMTIFAEETGRARALSSQMVKDVYLIGKGTGLGVEQGAKLAAQFELMGYDARATMEYVQGVVETSELMGVNTVKVMKNISDNFNRLQKYTFRKGVSGFAEMAKYAEKMKVDMSQALDSAETARSLENAVDLAANLQILGGEFAKSDPFQLLFLARNDPEEYTKKLNKMIKGVATFRKTVGEDGKTTFESFISPADQDRLRMAEKSLGLQAGELSIQAKRMAEIQLMRQKMVGMGLTSTEKQIVEGMAKFQTETGQFTVTIGNHTKDIRDLTENELKILKAQKSSLEERAEHAQTFDEVFKATIEELKTALLPLVRTVNDILVGIRPTIKWFTESVSNIENAWLKGAAVAGTFTAAALLLKGSSMLISGTISKFARVITPKKLAFLSQPTGKNAAQTLASGKTSRAAGIGSGAKSFGAMAGVGAAAAGIGGGIAMASRGIGDLAQSIKDVDIEKLKQLNKTVIAIGGTMAAILIPSLFALAPAGLAAAPALLAVGAAATGIGFGINLAGKGIGQMAEGLGSLITSAKDAGPALGQIDAGIMGMGAGLALIGPSALFGLPALAMTLKTIEKRSDGLTKIAPALQNLTQLSGMKEDFAAVEKMINTISNANLENLKNLSALKDMKDIFSKPLKVEFSDKEVNMVSNVSLNIDGYKFVQKLGIAEKVAITQKELKGGKESGR